MSKFKYVFLGSEGELAGFSFSDLKLLKNTLYIPGFYSQFSATKKKIFHLHTNNYLNRILNIPFKTVWRNTILKNVPLTPESDETLVYICQRGWADYEQQVHFIDYIKRINPDAKFVLFLEDLFSTYKIHDRGNNPYTLEFVNKTFDLIISFDQGDCERYGFIYHPLVFSKYHDADGIEPTVDVYFLGAAKNRLDEIIAAFEVLSGHGLKCDIHIAGVEKEKRKYVDIIDYEPQITYMENLRLASRAKCILELMQKGGKGFTQRTYEAIGLGKMLLTNNGTINTAPFYCQDYIIQFDSLDSIDEHKIEAIKRAPKYIDYHYIDKISPIEFVEFIESYLEKQVRN